MRKLIALVFSVAALAAGASPAWANLGRDHSGSPGTGDNCSGWYNSKSGNPTACGLISP
jgi:hypothetical protein